jgi:predicted phage baseplate assembly protein
MQAFTLKQPPLTYVSAPTKRGIESTLVVRVNDIKWKVADSLAELMPQDHNFVTKTDDEAKTTVIFGNGEKGARLPTGIENVIAVYRNGIGKPGNVKAEQIITLITKPLGVKEVVNPLRASGGADKETRDQARRNVPVALMALDRLVSTKDYADFARTFAGIGKASATRLPDGYQQIVHLTIAGTDDIPIDVNSDLYNNLRRALLKYGNSFVPFQIAMRGLLALVIVANVHIHPDYLWESVEPKIRTALLNTFSFERRELGQSVFLSEVISVIQAVKGVLYVDVDILDSISETEIKSEKLLEEKKSRWTDPNRTISSSKQYVHAKLAWFDKDNNKILPAQLAYLTPDVPDTLILKKIEEVKK